MIGVVAAFFLISMLLLVHFSAERQRSKERRAEQSLNPLDQDEGLVLPWAGHASNVFSLTALFGGYTVIAVALGFPALLGLATGGIAALLFMKHIISTDKPASFHQFLVSRSFSPGEEENQAYWLLLIATQLLLAISEIVILREVALNGFDLAPSDATVFAVCLAMVAYFYSLIGKYDGIFRTDVVQLFLLMLMCIVSAFYAASSILSSVLIEDNLLAHPLKTDAWIGAFEQLYILRHPINFAVGIVAGSSLLLSSPDTWKRIYLTASSNGQGINRSFVGLLLAGAIPFALLLPVLLVMPKPDLNNPEIFAPLHAAIDNRFVLLTIILGMMASFLSTFDGALISATHLLLARSDAQRRRGTGVAHFHIFLGGAFLVIFTGSLAFILGTGNPYLPGVLVLGMYAILGGAMLATRLGSAPTMPDLQETSNSSWVVVLGLSGWLVLVLSFEHVVERPIPEQLLLVPAAAGVYLLFFLLSYLRIKRSR